MCNHEPAQLMSSSWSVIWLYLSCLAVAWHNLHSFCGCIVHHSIENAAEWKRNIVGMTKHKLRVRASSFVRPFAIARRQTQWAAMEIFPPRSSNWLRVSKPKIRPHCWIPRWKSRMILDFLPPTQEEPKTRRTWPFHLPKNFCTKSKNRENLYFWYPRKEARLWVSCGGLTGNG